MSRLLQWHEFFLRWHLVRINCRQSAISYEHVSVLVPQIVRLQNCFPKAHRRLLPLMAYPFRSEHNLSRDANFEVSYGT